MCLAAVPNCLAKYLKEDADYDDDDDGDDGDDDDEVVVMMIRW